MLPKQACQHCFDSFPLTLFHVDGCRFRGVSKKKGKWEAKVMVNRKWAYRELFDSEEEAARAYDGAVWRLKPKEAKSYVNFKERPGQASTKLAKAARLIERAHAKSVLPTVPLYITF